MLASNPGCQSTSVLSWTKYDLDKFFTHYFSFPLSVSFLHCSILIHSSITHEYNVFLPLLLFSPVSIIPPLLHTHSFIYHPWCIMFFSHYFSFPLSVSFLHCSILIHLSPTMYNVFLPLLQFSPVSIIPPLLHTHSFIYHPRCIMFFSHYFSFPCQYQRPLLHINSIICQWSHVTLATDSVIK